jgi:myosin heavy subunit
LTLMRISQLPSSPNRTGPGHAKAAVPTLGSVFKRDLQSLLNAIEEADPHFVRCMAQILKSLQNLCQ